ncbi:hypothetical protein ES332_D11G300300v1 [Gossypium tomentosum]|uniref:PSII 6.1 kDa protein n=1 Tax=Gossypium tomentosum TaxID=34277 RepID=A0A5D2IVN9_GOSTO|nr:hypothetical protein ES332_D11G300300v1 [Gossypium tomentosum]TYH45934.1 hypothetical protein ES332_D11G300300v1 [Gossypium tomentosum]
MATITVSNFAVVLTKATLKGSNKVQSSKVLGLPVMATNGRARCSLEQKSSSNRLSSNPRMVASMMAAVAAVAVTTTATPAMALVDESLSTEGTGLPFGLSNNLLG